MMLTLDTKKNNFKNSKNREFFTKQTEDRNNIKKERTYS